MKTRKPIFLIGLTIALLPLLGAAVPSDTPEAGTLMGRVTDEAGTPLPGASVSLYGSSLMGMRGHVTSAAGRFYFPMLSPGVYDIRVEMPGFKIQLQKGLLVDPGRTTQLHVRLEETAVDEEVSVPAGDQAVDTRTSKTSTILDANVLARIPMGRDLSGILSLLPGAVADVARDDRLVSISGGSPRSPLVLLEGAVMNDPVSGRPLGNLNFDVYDIVEAQTAGLPASSGAADGSYIQILTRDGSNRFRAGAGYQTTGDDLSQDLDPAADPVFRTRPPERYLAYRDLALNLGGSLMDDRAWIFLAGRRLTTRVANPYAPEDRLVRLGIYDSPHYDIDHREWLGFARLSVQATKQVRYSGLFHFNSVQEPYDASYVAPDVSADRVPTRGPERILATTHNINILINQNTYADVRASLVFRGFSLTSRLQDGSPASFDAVQKVWWGAPPYESDERVQRLAGGASIAHFREDLVGVDHEFKAGVDFEQAEHHQDWYRQNPYTTYWSNFVSGNPYFYDGQSLGRLEILAGPNQPGTWDLQSSTRRFSAFVQDTLSRKRLAVNVGLRFDFAFLIHPDQSRSLVYGDYRPEFLNPEITATDLLEALEAQFLESGEISPFTPLTVGFRKPVSFLSFSPRIGLVYDLLGDGRAALKFSYSRMVEPLWISAYDQGQFLGPQSVDYIWRDFDGNGLMDLPGTDAYTLTSYRLQDGALNYYDGIEPPKTDEFTFGLDVEAAKDLRLGLSFIRRKTTNIVEDVDAVNGYDPLATDELGRIWLPLNVTDPGLDGRFGTTDDLALTVYGLRADRPAPVWKAANPPEAVRTYWSAAFTLDKRLSRNWQMKASVAYTALRGTADFAPEGSLNRTFLFNDPNALINTDGPLAYDRPLQIKILGTFVLPANFALSAFFQYYSGAPWARTLSRIYFPAGYMGFGTREPYLSVFAEPWGTRRSAAYTNLDLRLDKGFALRKGGLLSLTIDVFNAMGRHGLVLDEDPAGILDERKSPASYETSATYGSIVNMYGARQIRIGVKYAF